MAPVKVTVLFQQESAVYFPGQIVTGTVRVENKSNLRCNGIEVKFKGKTKVEFTATTKTKTRNSKGGTSVSVKNQNYFGNEEYYRNVYRLWGDKDKVLEAGVHTYPVTFQLPVNCPPSFQSENGNILHYCMATVHCIDSKKVFCKRPFSVNAIYDLNSKFELKDCKSHGAFKKVGLKLCGTGLLTMEVQLNRSGFVSGEDIIVSGECKNESSKRIKNIKMELSMLTTYIAEGQKKRKWHSKMNISLPGIAKKETFTFDNHRVRIPPLPPTELQHCTIIGLQYFFNVSMNPKGLTKGISVEIPITIGTIPFRDTFGNYTPTGKGHEAEVPSAPLGDNLGFVADSGDGAGPSSAYEGERPPAYTPVAFPGFEIYPDMPPPKYMPSLPPGELPVKRGLDEGQDLSPTAPPPSEDRPFYPSYVSYDF